MAHTSINTSSHLNTVTISTEEYLKLKELETKYTELLRTISEDELTIVIKESNWGYDRYWVKNADMAFHELSAKLKHQGETIDNIRNTKITFY